MSLLKLSHITVLIVIVAGSAVALPRAADAYWLEVASACTESGYIAVESVVFAESAGALFASQLSILILIDAGWIEAITAPPGHDGTTDPNYLSVPVPQTPAYTLTTPSSPPSYYHLLPEGWSDMEVAISNARAYRQAQRRYNTAVLHGDTTTAQAQLNAGGTFLQEVKTRVTSFGQRWEAYSDSLAADPGGYAGYGRLELHVHDGVQAVKDSFALYSGFPPAEKDIASALKVTIGEQRAIVGRIAGLSPAAAVQALGDSLPIHRVFHVVAESALVVATLPNSAWGYPFSYSYTPAGLDAPSVSAVRELAQNTPNPFNPATTIRFALSKPSVVAVRIYDMHGRLVRVLGAGPEESGWHSITWDGMDGEGSKVPSGVYFYRLNDGAGSEVRKMTLLR